ncbi:MAG: hypothetical protein II983_01290 [Firmicutes bacterium]|nr:hypothetical protein [Bacillota bacterium]MBQ6686411.1 hypothetical protein [Bacillota bacterium]
MKSDVTVLKTDVADLKTDVSGLKSDVTDLKSDVSGLKSDVTVLKTDVADLKTDVSGLKSDVADLKIDVSDLKETTKRHGNELRSIKLMLENEIRPSIRIIAEGHLDLNRKMNDLIQMHTDDEMFRLRVTALENDVREIKEHIA